MTLLATLGGALLASAPRRPVLEARQFLAYRDWPLTFNEDFDEGLRLLADGEAGLGWYPRYAASGPATGGGYFPVVRDGGGVLQWGGFSTLPGEFEMYLDPRVPEYLAHTPFSTGPSKLIITMNKRTLDIPQNDTQWQPFTSGCLISMLGGKGFAQSYGYFEGRIKLNPGYGTWPALWMLTADGNWPPEIDILERFTSYPQDFIATTVHTRSKTPGYTYGGQAWLPDGPPHYSQGWSQFHTGLSDPSNGFHLYGMEWTPYTITYFYDRQPVKVMVTPADLADGRQMYILLNFAADYNTTTWPELMPVNMEIDWIRVWGMPPTAVPPIDGPSPWDLGVPPPGG